MPQPVGARKGEPGVDSPARGPYPGEHFSGGNWMVVVSHRCAGGRSRSAGRSFRPFQMENKLTCRCWLPTPLLRGGVWLQHTPESHPTAPGVFSPVRGGMGSRVGS